MHTHRGGFCCKVSLFLTMVVTHIYNLIHQRNYFLCLLDIFRFFFSDFSCLPNQCFKGFVCVMYGLFVASF